MEKNKAIDDLYVCVCIICSQNSGIFLDTTIYL